MFNIRVGLEFIAGSTCLVCAALYYPSVKSSLIEKGWTEDKVAFIIQMFAQVGKFGIAGSFALIYNYTAELYPTVIRYALFLEKLAFLQTLAGPLFIGYEVI